MKVSKTTLSSHCYDSGLVEINQEEREEGDIRKLSPESRFQVR